MTRADQAAQIGQQSIEIALHRLEQLCNRCHNTSLVARS
jgi:cytochrome c556